MKPKEIKISSHYEPSINGLRAIAIILVISYHAFPLNIKGGFIGVDIFFVISGFLISRVIIENLSANNFSVLEFYIRRIIRIMPALALVLGFSLIFGYFSLLGDEYEALGKHVAAGTIFYSNFILWRESGYFDTSSSIKPLLHLWSLSIEAQFYIIWPLVLWLFWKKYSFKLKEIVLVILVISFTLNIAIVHGHPIAAFYFPLTRAWEFMIGAYLYIWIASPSSAIGSKKLIKNTNRILGTIKKYLNPIILSNVLSFFGVITLFISAYFINKEIYFPGWWAALPTIGTGLIIAAGKDAWINCKVLNTRPLIWIGLISYPLYLWHWTLLSLATVLSAEDPSFLTRIGIIFISIPISFLTFYFVERKMQNTNHRTIKIIFLSFMMIVLVIVGCLIYRNQGYPIRMGEVHWGDYSGQKFTRLQACDPVPDVVDSWCRTTASPTIALLGDSHADLLAERFIQNGNKNFSEIVSMGAGNCQPSLDGDKNSRCYKQISSALKSVVSDSKIKYVILTSWNTGVGDRVDQSINGFNEVFEALRNSNKKIIYIVDIPTLKGKPRYCIETTLYIRNKLLNKPNFCKGATEDDIVPRDNYNKVVNGFRNLNPDILVFNPLAIFCDGSLCKISDGSVVYYSDEGHLSSFGAQLVVNDLIEYLENKSTHK